MYLNETIQTKIVENIVSDGTDVPGIYIATCINTSHFTIFPSSSLLKYFHAVGVGGGNLSEWSTYILFGFFFCKYLCKTSSLCSIVNMN